MRAFARSGALVCLLVCMAGLVAGCDPFGSVQIELGNPSEYTIGSNQVIVTGSEVVGVAASHETVYASISWHTPRGTDSCSSYTFSYGACEKGLSSSSCRFTITFEVSIGDDWDEIMVNVWNSGSDSAYSEDMVMIRR
jgi:hypothetical protein